MTETPGHLNSRKLLQECADAVREVRGYNSSTKLVEAVYAVITVLRRRGLLNDLGVEIVRAEMGDRK